MARKRHTPEQVLNKLREADTLLNGGSTVAAVSEHLGVSEQTYHRWRQQYGGMKAGEAKRLKELDLENLRLKKAIADLTLDKLILKEANDLLGKA